MIDIKVAQLLNAMLMFSIKLSVNLSIVVLNKPGCQSQAVQELAMQLLNTLN